MSRWHKSSCNSPKVSVAGGLPCCESCGSSPNIPTLISEQAGYDPPWAMPPDEKFGEMNLFWPDPALYSSQSQATAKVGSEELSESDTGEGQDVPSPIYSRRLKDDEFRLLCLSAANDDTQPIHASLEAYRTDDCPEYEAVSYCWGGENGDATLCKPVFLGDYWDVLLQTSNCWSMLRYLRSRVGARIIWVDAMCIQQKDHQERESQVTMMGNIYERCLRAIVYLGEDAVRPPSHNNRAYPARRDLNKVSAAAVDLHQVLKMRYFQRVWVIQELIQAPMVVIPVRGVKLIVGRRMANPKEVAWHESDAPWMRHICTGQSDPALTMMLEQTSNSQSTDPRDKVFGLLGFLPETKKLRPNYLLSSLHIYIGTIAYMLLNEGHSLLLTEAAGHQAPPTVPSWLPDGNLSNLGVLLQKLASSASMSTSRKNTSFWKEVLELNPDWDILLEPMLIRLEEEFGALKTLLPALEKPSIHPSTLALSLPLIFLFQFSSRPVRLQWDGILIDAFEITVSNCTIYIRTSDSSLDTAIEPGPTSVFLLKDTRNSPLLLFMQRSDPFAHYRLLKCCPCSGIFLSRQPPSKSTFPPIPQMASPDSHFYENDGSFSGESSDEDELYTKIANEAAFKPSIFFKTVYDVVSMAQDLRNKAKRTLETIRTRIHPLDPDIATGHILSLFHRLYISSDGPFLDLYFNVLQQCSPNCSAEIKESGKETWVWVTMDPTGWLIAHHSLNYQWHEHGLVDGFPWFWARVPGSSDPIHEKLETLEINYSSTTHHLSSWTTSDGTCRRAANAWNNSQTVTMVVSEEALRKWLKLSWGFLIFPHLKRCSGLVGEDEMTLATTDPKPECRSTCYYDWPECFFDGEHIPGKQENISIF
ncbi:hypothetical protein BHE90_012033 [Fusarium euwallaceae]|uniref:Heterokaryon incompatibility domain-containing protein n=1 Tax=Fusarium euwallaceae TaxID=1147111 RepID=A0A430LCV7_9HYPO|nr:hypothetical protein BHE90_012033 [Fusarium euwallaceae]